MWSKPLLCRFWQSGEIPQMQVPQGFAAFRLAPSRIPPRHSQIKRATNCAIPGYLILNHYSTKFVRLKDYSVCGHLCGQSRFYTAFGNRGKSSKRRCRKALRRFDLPRPGYNHGTPKAGALPAALHPVIKLFHPAGRILPNQARYQLRYTRIFNFCHYTTVERKIKVFSVCGHLCGQSRFCAVFGNRRKTRYRPCRKALRAFVQAAHG